MGFFDFLPKKQEPQQATPEQLRNDIMPLAGFGSILSQSYNPDELIGQKSIRIYYKMENDEQVKAALSLKIMAALMSGWDIRPASDEQTDIDIANFVTENLDNIDGTFSQKLEEILGGGLTFGYSISEKVYAQKDGKWYLSKIKSKKPDSIQFQIDEYGNLTALLNAGQEYPIDKFVRFTYQGKFDNNFGVSDLKSAYRAWWYKENTYKYLAIYLEKYATPPLAITIDGNITPSEETKLKALLNRIQNNMVMMIPKNIKAEFLKIGDQAQIYERAISIFDAAIAKSILLPSQLGLSNEPSTGSNAKAQTHFDMFLMVVSRLQKQIEEVVNEQIIKQLVSLNFSTDKYPHFNLRLHESENIDVILKQWNELLKNGALTKQTQDEEWIRGLLGAPLLDKEGVAEPQEFSLKKFGGEGSGNFGHDGRPGEVGGSGVNSDKFLDKSLPAHIRARNFAGQVKNELEKKGYEVTLSSSASTTSQYLSIMTGKDEYGIPTYDKIRVSDHPSPHFSSAKEIGLDSLNHDSVSVITSNYPSISPYKYKTYATRDPSKYEINVNYAQIDKESEQMVQKGKEKLAKVLNKTKDDIVNRNWEGVTASDINKLGLKYMNELQQNIKAFVGDAYDMGYMDSQSEIKADKSDKKAYVTRIKPEKALKFFETKSFWMTGVIEDTILKAVKGILYKALEAGWNNDVIRAELIKIFEPYVDLGIVSADTVKDYRLDTIIRTIFSEVYNAGRKESQFDPANEGFVVGLMYSAIMDKRTTELCSGLDGKIFLVDNPYLQQLYPPNHFNERSIMTSITKDMLPIPEGDLVTDAEVANAVTLKGEGF